MKAFVCVALLLAVAVGVRAQLSGQSASITIQFDNRGSKVASPSVNQKVIRALADSVFRVPPGQVRLVGRMGQSSLFNHQSIVTYRAVGPTLNGKSPLVNCQAAIKSGWIRSSPAKKAIEKATDGWIPGDSLKLEKATCN